MTIPSFRRSSAPKLGAKDGERVRKRERWRGSRQERGYGREWEVLAAEYKKAVKGQCEECRRRGYLAPADVVDHMIPITDKPEVRLDWNALDCLCHSHHNGLKRRIEDYARKTGQLELIPRWMKHPETRPAQFQIMKRGPLAGLFDADQDEGRRSGK